MLSVRVSRRKLCEPLSRHVEHLVDRFSCVRQLSLADCHVDPPSLLRLSRALHANTTLYSLDLSRTRLADDGAMLLAAALQRNSSLRMLALTGNALTSHGCRLVVTAIGRARALTELDLSDNCIGDAGCRSVADLLASRDCPLRRLVVCHNRLGGAGAAAVFAALRRNSRLVQLELSRNEIGDESSRELTTALIYNRTLRHLALADCRLTTDTCCQLARPLRTNSVLRVLVLDANELIGDAGVQVVADSVRYNRSLRQLSFAECGLTGLAVTHVIDALRYNNTLRTVDLRPSPSNRPPDDGSHDNVTSSPAAAELSRVLRANPLLRILT